jgi:hypothetical protein
MKDRRNSYSFVSFKHKIFTLKLPVQMEDQQQTDFCASQTAAEVTILIQHEKCDLLILELFNDILSITRVHLVSNERTLMVGKCLSLHVVG